MNIYPLSADYFENKPLKINNIFENSRINSFKVPELNLNNNYKLLAPNYPTYPDLYSNSYMCMTTPLERTIRCRKTQILKLPY
tara:strand:+ start:276 stop:524 length:249 start_codon:yes stop_codon:yes gene_type:complete